MAPHDALRIWATRARTKGALSAAEVEMLLAQVERVLVEARQAHQLGVAEGFERAAEAFTDGVTELSHPVVQEAWLKIGAAMRALAAEVRGGSPGGP